MKLQTRAMDPDFPKSETVAETRNRTQVLSADQVDMEMLNLGNNDGNNSQLLTYLVFSDSRRSTGSQPKVKRWLTGSQLEVDRQMLLRTGPDIFILKAFIIEPV